MEKAKDLINKLDPSKFQCHVCKRYISKTKMGNPADFNPYLKSNPEQPLCGVCLRIVLDEETKRAR